MSRLVDAVRSLPPISLERVQGLADLQVRVDRKYLLPAALATEMVEDLGPSFAALDIADRRSFAYESVYFDTADKLAYLLHARGRPRRFKVRTRTYLDSGQSMVEVKTEGAQGRTVKVRREHPLVDRHRLTPAALGFVREQLIDEEVCDRLGPSVVTAYDRSTLVDTSGHTRITLDRELVFRSGASVHVAPVDLVMVETKSSGARTPADRWLSWHRLRPVSVSKYCVGAALADPTLPASRWSRVLRRHFDWSPARTSDARGLRGSSTLG